MIVPTIGYNKYLVPPPINNETVFSVEISYSIREAFKKYFGNFSLHLTTSLIWLTVKILSKLVNWRFAATFEGFPQNYHIY